MLEYSRQLMSSLLQSSIEGTDSSAVNKQSREEVAEAMKQTSPFIGRWRVVKEITPNYEAEEENMDKMLEYCGVPGYLRHLNRLGNSYMDVSVDSDLTEIQEKHCKFGGLYTGTVNLVMNGEPQVSHNPLTQSRITTVSKWEKVNVSGQTEPVLSAVSEISYEKENVHQVVTRIPIDSTTLHIHFKLKASDREEEIVSNRYMKRD
mmetsp:Transcript_16041/g.18150  ORF Transcript_16041/g.18150 Transcript_16041/m.18150 type:complete len:205 (-) Transcript_16041:126-740(-)